MNFIILLVHNKIALWMGVGRIPATVLSAAGRKRQPTFALNYVVLLLVVAKMTSSYIKGHRSFSH